MALIVADSVFEKYDTDGNKGIDEQEFVKYFGDHAALEQRIERYVEGFAADSQTKDATPPPPPTSPRALGGERPMRAATYGGKGVTGAASFMQQSMQASCQPPIGTEGEGRGERRKGHSE